MVRKVKAAKPITFISLFLAFLFLFTSIAAAVDRPLRLVTRTGTTGDQNTATASGKQSRLDQVKLKVCQNKQARIKTRSQNLVRRGQLIFSRFDRIAERVKQYYTNRLVPKGITIENYDQMLSDIEAKKAAVKEAANKAENTAKGFSCSSDNPKEQLQAFRQDMVGVIRALKDYKESVIKLLVAVRTKAKNLKSSTATGSATL